MAGQTNTLRIRTHKKYFLFPVVRLTVIGEFTEQFWGGCGYIYCKYAGLYKNTLTLCTWRNGLRLAELAYLFPRTSCKFGVAKDLH